jgi:hypothetical protein
MLAIALIGSIIWIRFNLKIEKKVKKIYNTQIMILGFISHLG